jgi:16S rRNA (cytosine967-C5)-methyltransferase
MDRPPVSPQRPRRPVPSTTSPAAERPSLADDAQRPGLGARRVAARLLAAVVDARTSLDGLTDRGNGHPEFRKLEGRDQALVRAILLAALRRRGTIDAILADCLEKALPSGASALRHILHVASAQILFLDVPDSAAVDLAVASAQADPRSARFANLTNAVLRRIARDKAGFLARFDDPALDAPRWLLDRLEAAYGAAGARAILHAQRVPAPLDLTCREDPSLWAERLGGSLLPTGTVRLGARETGAVDQMAGFADGAWWVQDAAAALPARLFGDVAGLRALDACAAPGGKTAQLAAAGARVTALDISASRLRRLRGNLERLRLEADMHEGSIEDFRDAEGFDAVLLDAPCSSTGTIRRHPDVPFTKTVEEVEKLAGVQERLLRAAADHVRPGGLLVFSNCSLDPREGEDTARRFLAERGEFQLVPVAAAEVPGIEDAVTREGFLRTTPAMLRRDTAELSGLDGFFAARFRRGM